MNAYQAKREIILHYMDLVGIVTIDRNPTPESTKNGLMHNGLVSCLYKALNVLDNHDIDAFKDTVKDCEELPGLYDRYSAYDNKPRNNDADSHDDAAGVFALSKVCGLAFHKEILSYGAKNTFFYNNQNPGVLIDDVNPLKWEWWALRLRLLDQIAWYYLGNNRLRFLSPLLMLFLSIKIFTSKAGSGRLLDYMMVESLAVDKWEWRKFRKWALPRSKLVESAQAYFHPDHPIVDLAKAVVST